MGICLVSCAWPLSQLLNGVSGKAHSGSAPICTLWVLYLAGSECEGGGVLECSCVMCWYIYMYKCRSVHWVLCVHV